MEKWREPIRSRDKDWKLDSLRLTLERQHLSYEVGPLDAPRSVGHAQWSQLSGPLTSQTATKEERRGYILPKIRFFRRGGVVSDDYSVVTIYGLNMHGRVYGEGIVAPRFDNNLLASNVSSEVD